MMVVHEDEEPSGRGYNKNKHNSGYGDSARTPSPLQRGKGGNVRLSYPLFWFVYSELLLVKFSCLYQILCRFDVMNINHNLIHSIHLLSGSRG